MRVNEMTLTEVRQVKSILDSVSVSFFHLEGKGNGTVTTEYA